jgi:hypothetical protein
MFGCENPGKRFSINALAGLFSRPDSLSKECGRTGRDAM